MVEWIEMESPAQKAEEDAHRLSIFKRYMDAGIKLHREFLNRLLTVGTFKLEKELAEKLDAWAKLNETPATTQPAAPSTEAAPVQNEQETVDDDDVGGWQPGDG